jgi:hypothetical protein
MITWNAAYGRLLKTKEFRAYFGSRLKMEDFRSISFAQALPAVATIAATAFGPLRRDFPSGAIVLGVTASAFQAPYVIGAGTQNVIPSVSPGLRNLFRLNFQYSGNEVITPDGPISAEALMGNGYDTIFPAREWVIPPSQAILVSGTTLAQGALGVATPMLIDIVYHCMVPRAVG